MSALEDAGMAPSKLSIVGEADKPTKASRARGKKGAPAAADHLELHVETE